jgi:acid phosphatase (class A)
VPGTLAEAADRLTDGAAADAAADAAAWSRAASLNGVRTPAFRQALSCALGVVLSEADTPAIIRLLRRTNEEMRVLTDAAQTHFRRPRPFGDEPGRSCDPDAATLGPSYPSGQAATGWLWALALSDARPERRAELLGFGAEAGDIRISCRAHWLSDVAGGRLLASALHSQLSALPAYQADVAAARAEAQSAPSLALEACS